MAFYQKTKRATASSTLDDQPTSKFNNLISNTDIFPAMATLPHRSTTLLPDGSTPAPAGCASPHPCSTTKPQASTTIVPYDVELCVPDIPTTVHRDQPPDSMPRPTSFTTSISSVNCVVGLDKNLTGHGRGHGVTECSPNSVAGHQQPESATMPVSLPVSPNVKTVVHAASIS